jgi:peroxiredoxin family protein
MSETMVDVNHHHPNYNQNNTSGTVIMEQGEYDMLLTIVIIFSIIVTLEFIVFFYFVRKSVVTLCYQQTPISRIMRKRPLQIQMGKLSHTLEISPTEELDNLIEE